MMMSNGGSLFSGLVGLVVVVALIAIVAGAALGNTNLLNFNTSAADMRAKDQATNSQAQRDAIDLKVYEAQKRYELLNIEANIRTQQQAAALQTAKAQIDQHAYQVQEMAQAMKQVADAKQYEAQQLAQIRAAEQNQAQQRAEQAARAAQDLKSANLLNIALVLALIVVALAVAAGVIFFTVTLTWPRLQRARLELAAAKVVAQSRTGRTAAPEPDALTQPTQATALRLEKAPSKPTMPQRDDHEYWREKRIQARANEVALRNMQLQGDLPQGLNPVKYQDLPLAAMKNDLTNNDSGLNG